MSTPGIFPTRDDERNVYYNNAIPYIDANKVRLTVTPASVTNLLSQLANWNTTYPKVKDANLSTKTFRDEKNELVKKIEEMLREVYADIPASLLTEADRNTLNLKKRDLVPTGRAAISITPYIKVNSLNGALIDIICRTDSDSTRASKLKGADGIEMQYSVGGTAPASPADCPKNYFSTKSRFKLQLDVADATKKVHCFFRWKINSDAAKSGPWTKLISAVISD